MRRVIITDLTRFAAKDTVCTAAIDIETGECLRPLPHLSSDKCAELNIQPGAILEGNLVVRQNAANPHVEDADYSKLEFHGASTAEDFKSILDNSLSTSVSNGFGIHFADGQKYIPVAEQANCSIITLKVNPRLIQIHEDKYKPGKIKLSFMDESGQKFRYLSITDRGFFDYAERHYNDGTLQDLQKYVNTQDEVYLRIGVARVYEIQGKKGYWLQVNGIYTFPNFHQEIRSYK